MIKDMTEIKRVQVKIDELEFHLSQLKNRLKQLENPLYKAGQIFKDNRGDYYLLSQVDYSNFCLIDIRTGNRYDEPKLLDGHEFILQEIQDKLFSRATLTPVNVKIAEV